MSNPCSSANGQRGSIAIVFRLEGTRFIQIEIVRLLIAHLTQTDTQVVQMSSGDFFVELEQKSNQRCE